MPWTLLTLALLACKDKDPEVTTDDTEEPTVIFDTDSVIDEETGDSTPTDDTVDTVDTDTDTLIDTDTDPPDTDDEWEGPQRLAIYPAQIAVHVGAEFTLRAVATDFDGNVYDDTPIWTVSSELAEPDPEDTGDTGEADDTATGDTATGDTATGDTATADTGDTGGATAPAPPKKDKPTDVATVDVDGNVVALAGGVATITATIGDAVTTARVEVRTDGVMLVTVVDGETGAPIPEARIVDRSEKVITDKAGAGQLQVPDGGDEVWVMAYGPDSEGGYIPAVITGVVGRELVIPLRHASEEDDAGVRVAGNTDLSDCVSSDWDELIVGIAASSLQDSPLFFDAAALLSGDRPVDFVVGEVNLPSNLYLESYVEDYVARTFAGDFGIWTLAGPVLITEAAGGISDSTDALQLLEDNLSDFRFGWSGGHSGEDGDEPSVNIRPSIALSDTVSVDVPALSLGFRGDEEALLLAVHAAGVEGSALTGLAIAAPETTEGVRRVDPADVSWAGEGQIVAYGEVGGAGTGGARVISMANVIDGAAAPPAWQAVPNMDTFTASDRRYRFVVDEDAELVRIYVRSGGGGQYDFYFPPKAENQGIMPSLENGPAMDWTNSFWHLTSVDTSVGSYESMVIEGAVTTDDLAENALSTAYVMQHFSK